jgi:serine/threonine protein kinase
VDGHAVVLKELRLDRLADWKAMQLFEREAQVMAELSHPGIPDYIEFFGIDSGKTYTAARVGQARLVIANLDDITTLGAVHARHRVYKSQRLRHAHRRSDIIGST